MSTAQPGLSLKSKETQLEELLQMKKRGKGEGGEMWSGEELMSTAFSVFLQYFPRLEGDSILLLMGIHKMVANLGVVCPTVGLSVPSGGHSPPVIYATSRLDRTSTYVKSTHSSWKTLTARHSRVMEGLPFAVNPSPIVTPHH